MLVFGCGAAENEAHAQTADYFSTPWIVAPTPANQSNATQTNAPPNGEPSGAGNVSPGGHSGLYARLQAQAAPNAPSWTLTEHVGIDEIATDNTTGGSSDRTADLASLFSAGGTATADTSRLTGILTATGLYRRAINNTGSDGFSGYGYLNGQGTIIRDTVFMSIHGVMDDINRQGAGITNPLVQSPQDTQIFQISGSPYIYTPADDFGINLIRYQVSQVWFNRNTGAFENSGVTVGPISASTNQLVREDFKMPGTIFPRLLTDVSLSGSENDSGGTGDFTRFRGELINEYELTRFASLIGGGGYERLHDNTFSVVNGDDPVWDVGTRLRPNADSYALLTYGHHDLRSDFAGELVWRLTALTNIYAAYTDAITNAQQMLLANNDTSELGPEGTVTHVTFDESTLIGTLDDELLGAPPGTGGLSLSPFGIPVTDLNNTIPLDNGLFRIKSLRASGNSTFENSPIVLTFLRLDSTRLTGLDAFAQAGDIDVTNGAILTWKPALNRMLSGYVSLRYYHSDVTSQQPEFFFYKTVTTVSNNYGVSLGLTQILSDSLTAVLRYDLTYHEPDNNVPGSLQNALTLGLHKTFY